MALTEVDPPAAHYNLCAYVCGPACIRPSPFEGWATFLQIFQQRPDGCRFAIAQRVPLLRTGPASVAYADRPEDRFICWDLFDDSLFRTRFDMRLLAPTPVWTGDTEDGVVMKAMALYEQDNT